MSDAFLHPPSRYHKDSQTWQVTPSQRVEIRDRFINGDSAIKMGAEYGVGYSAIYEIAWRMGAPKRAPRGVKRNINHNAFAAVTESSAYWIGFLMANGTIKRNFIQFCLKERERVHIEAFREFLGSDHLIRTRSGTDQLYLTVNSRQVVTDLAKYGVLEAAAGIAECVPQLEANRDFWRGVVDGDGQVTWTHTYRYPKITLSGRLPLVMQFREFVKSHVATENGIGRYKTRHQFSITGSKAVPIARALYEGAITYLPRKHAVAMRMLTP